jgi:hypothetical protein
MGWRESEEKKFLALIFFCISIFSSEALAHETGYIKGPDLKEANYPLHIGIGLYCPPEKVDTL